ncbi:hypothetical protein JCM3766R1_005374 [Sporobolomyces carnicolor]
MGGCSSDGFLSTGPLVGLSIAGIFLFEGLVAVLVWLFVVVRRGRRAKRSRNGPALRADECEEEGETTLHTHRSSFVEKWLGREATTTYTPVEFEEYQPTYASYSNERYHAGKVPSRNAAPASLQARVSHDQTGGDVSYYSTAVAASLALPPQTLYDPPCLPVVPRQRPELPRLDIPVPPLRPLPIMNDRAPSARSQISYLQRLSRSLLASFSPSPPPSGPALPTLPVRPTPPTPPPFMKSVDRSRIVSTVGAQLSSGDPSSQRRELVRPLPRPS